MRETKPMPLLKIWNALLGRSHSPVKPDDQPLAERPSAAKPKPTGRGILGIGGRGPHAALCKLLRSVDARTVLEISVGDGTRAVAVLHALAAGTENIRYAAIDQFEMSGGPITLKQYHRSLRAENIRAQLFPDTIERGLVQVGSTIGAIDLVLIGTEPNVWQTPTVQALLPRITHSQSVVLYRDGETWNRYQPTASNLRRAA